MSETFHLSGRPQVVSVPEGEKVVLHLGGDPVFYSDRPDSEKSDGWLKAAERQSFKSNRYVYSSGNASVMVLDK